MPTIANDRDRHRIAVLGATGSIGLATIDVVETLGQPWRIVAVSGHSQLTLLAEVSKKCPGARVVCSDPEQEKQAETDGRGWEFGPQALVDVASAEEVDTLVAAIVGRAGLESTLAAVEAGKRIALANKETMVVAGPLVQSLAERSGAEVLPVDSEHSAIFQCLAGKEGGDSAQLILTASGGPFRTWSRKRMQTATIEDALAHPTWEMGAKITIDSATMMNKALEIIEARWLFDVPAEQIEVVVHPQSILHSMVEFADGSVVAQLSPPDMRLPIQYAITYPQRLPCPAPRLDRTAAWDLRLEPVDRERFPAIDLGFEVASKGGSCGAVVNAANEEAVALFLNGRLKFPEIVAACRAVLENHNFETNPTLSQLCELDSWARTEVQRWSC